MVWLSCVPWSVLQEGFSFGYCWSRSNAARIPSEKSRLSCLIFQVSKQFENPAFLLFVVVAFCRVYDVIIRPNAASVSFVSSLPASSIDK
jgi:hypothetical protein